MMLVYCIQKDANITFFFSLVHWPWLLWVWLTVKNKCYRKYGNFFVSKMSFFLHVYDHYCTSKGIFLDIKRFRYGFQVYFQNKTIFNELDWSTKALELRIVVQEQTFYRRYTHSYSLHGETQGLLDADVCKNPSPFFFYFSRSKTSTYTS